jgi:hypothetical protein
MLSKVMDSLCWLAETPVGLHPSAIPEFAIMPAARAV